MKSLSLLLGLALSLPIAAQVKLTQGSDRILIEVDGKPFTDFFIGGSATKPYLYPLRAASGTIVTRHYPMQMVEGEPRDHIHQRSSWFSHGDVNGFDFWANDPSQQGPKKGKILVRKVSELKSGKKQGVIRALFDWNDAAGNKLLTEDRTMVIYSNPTERIVDFDIRLTAVGKVTFGDTKEGTFALRLAPELQENKGTGTMTNAQGAQKEKNVWGKKSEWVDYAGEIKGEKVGLAIFDHPTNPRHPTWWHSRGYGLFAANPFGQHDFEKSGNGALTLEAGQTVRFRYRLIIHAGDTAQAGLAAKYKKFASMK
jgi:hypothetical protein